MDELSDLEICTAIAIIEGINPMPELFLKSDGTANFNPLTDDGLCFRLMVKYELKISLYYKWGDETKYYCAENQDLDEFEALTPNKAICLAIIEVHKDEY